MASKSNETINGRYFYRWNSEEGQQALAIANKALAAAGIGLQIHYDTGMAPGLLGDLSDEAKAHAAQETFGVNAAATTDAQEQARQQAVKDAIAAAEQRAAEKAGK